jgi:hypothetical protein
MATFFSCTYPGNYLTVTRPNMTTLPDIMNLPHGVDTIEDVRQALFELRQPLRLTHDIYWTTRRGNAPSGFQSRVE